MNALHQAQTAYRTPDQSVRTARGIEYDAFARVTHRLKQAVAKPREMPHRMPQLAAAIHDNRRLWAVLATDVTDPANGLPADLRARILYLADFTRIYSSRVLEGAPATPLVDVNTAVMRGLRAGAAREGGAGS